MGVKTNPNHRLLGLESIQACDRVIEPIASQTITIEEISWSIANWVMQG